MTVMEIAFDLVEYLAIWEAPALKFFALKVTKLKLLLPLSI